jgi:hypothetical protein
MKRLFVVTFTESVLVVTGSSAATALLLSSTVRNIKRYEIMYSMDHWL